MALFFHGKAAFGNQDAQNRAANLYRVILHFLKTSVQASLSSVSSCRLFETIRLATLNNLGVIQHMQGETEAACVTFQSLLWCLQHEEEIVLHSSYRPLPDDQERQEMSANCVMVLMKTMVGHCAQAA
eukprot:CAMPEP_0178750204 /NCGR_PEP_ID=MMETSP0744-20121128/9835_1 /TAXON_ID=913974 /ORGANISM="Nitzschia punctata, Strain CCMP561" /LENGTH=127 /DNA_ID=CAMNT_0020403701 /DNA_START=39 /DNA_END=422 /DNA_ORIENTATION=-